MKYYIKAGNGYYKDKGFYDDHIINAFVYVKSGARFFDHPEDANVVLQGLLMDGIQGQILMEERPMNHERSLYDAARKMAAEAAEMIKEHPRDEVIQIVVVEPNKKPYKKVIPNTFEAFNNVVEGHYENLYVGEIKKGVTIGLIVNEEGKLLQLPFNRKIIDVDTLVGTFFITAYNVLGENISLTDKEADFLIKRFSNVEVKI